MFYIFIINTFSPKKSPYYIAKKNSNSNNSNKNLTLITVIMEKYIKM